jgi:exonuclease VII small subunit
MFDRGGDSLRRAETFLQDTKEQVGDALRTGQEAIRPVPSTREA